MANDTILMLVSWCPGDKCDPCQTGNVEIFGNYIPYDPFAPIPGGPFALVIAGGPIVSFPVFPISVSAKITLKGIYRPFVGEIDSPGGGVTIGGTNPAGSGDPTHALQGLCPLPSTFLDAFPGWTPVSSDKLLFNVVCKSATTSGASLAIGTVTVLFHSITGDIFDLSNKTRWTGDVT